MIPVLPPPALGQEIAACAVLGGCTGAVRAFFPVKSRAAILPDVLWVGAVLTAVQSYAAGESYAGVDTEIGRAVQQECRDRSRMPSSA